MTLRAIHTAEAITAEPGWITPFLDSLARDDLVPATLLRKGTIDRVLGMSELELGLQALLGTRPSGRR
jgi:hypothetical protein